jgi:hypothetical protein
MKNLIEYNEWKSLNEGGWASAKTQETPLTPQVISLVVKEMELIAAEFNSHLSELGLPSLDFVKPIGSGTWWKEDLKDQPEKTYGDVDYMVAYPTLKLTAGDTKADETATIKLYNKELLMLMEADKWKNIELEDTKEASTDTSVKLILKIEIEPGVPGWVQVDMVVTQKEYQDWAVFRYTPIRNVKGFVLGNLYSSFGEVLDVSIMSKGVRVKFEGEVMRPFNKRKNVSERVISANAQTFMEDIARFFWEQANTGLPYKSSDTLSNWKGMDRNNPQFEDLCLGIRAVADTLSSLGEFGSTIKYKSAQDLLTAVIDRYEKKMTDTAKSSKFDKAVTPAAKAVVEKIQGLITKYVALSKDLLK